jgi:XTP/dITP diphosphohydrolase
MKLLFCSSNIGKTQEIQYKFGESITIQNLLDIGCTEEIPETADTFAGNALLKACYGYDNFKVACFSDDSGLEVTALDNAPGVYSARYAGIPKSDTRNMDKLLFELQGVKNRNAFFKTVISYIDAFGNAYSFEGKIEGEILEEKRGSQGFGYDPIFLPKGYTKTFAEMNLAEKSNLSHRSIALEKFYSFLLKNS